MNRRIFFETLARGCFSFSACSLLGESNARRKIETLKIETANKTENEDHENNTGRESSSEIMRRNYNQVFWGTTVFVTPAAFMGSYLLCDSDILRYRQNRNLDQEISQIPEEKRPEDMQDISNYNKTINRRAFSERFLACAIFGGIGSTIGAYSSSSREISESIYGHSGDQDPGPSDAILKEKLSTRNALGLRNFILNVLGLASFSYIFGKTQSDKEAFEKKCELVLSHRANKLTNDGKPGTKISFLIDFAGSGFDICDLIPKELLSDYVIRVDIKRDSLFGDKKLISFVIEPEGDRFCVKNLAGNKLEGSFLLIEGDQVTLRFDKSQK